MPDPFIGEIRCFGFTFAPRGWATCAGQLLPISQNAALFSLLGTTYGGDGRITFALPDLRGRVPLSFGQGSGLADYPQGQVGGAEAVVLTPDQLPEHHHDVSGASAATTKDPAGALPAHTSSHRSYGTGGDVTMSGAMVAPAGAGAAHPNLPPYLVLNWCIALEGIFPARP